MAVLPFSLSRLSSPGLGARVRESFLQESNVDISYRNHHTSLCRHSGAPRSPWAPGRHCSRRAHCTQVSIVMLAYLPHTPKASYDHVLRLYDGAWMPDNAQQAYHSPNINAKQRRVHGFAKFGKDWKGSNMTTLCDCTSRTIAQCSHPYMRLNNSQPRPCMFFPTITNQHGIYNTATVAQYIEQ